MLATYSEVEDIFLDDIPDSVAIRHLFQFDRKEKLVIVEIIGANLFDSGKKY